MYIKTEDFKEKILDAYVSGESKTHKNAQTYYRERFLTKVRVIEEPPNQEVEHEQDLECATPNCIRYSGKHCSSECDDYTPVS